MACEPPGDPTAPLPPLETTLTKPAPAPDVGLPQGYSASAFYDGLRGPDGIWVLTNSQLLVVKEFGGDQGVYLAKKGRSYKLSDAFSTLGPPFVSPDDITVGPDGTVYVADGQAQTVWKIDRHGGAPTAFVTTATTRGSFNPFGVIFAPDGFDGPNVDPGDLIVSDNAYGGLDRAVWAVDPVTGATSIIAEGTVWDNGPIDMDLSSDGTLYVTENPGTTPPALGPYRILTLDSDGTVTPVYTGTAARTEIAIHPITDEIFFVIEDGMIYRMTVGGTPTLFASELGGTQDFEFNHAGNRLYVSSRVRQQVVQIHAVQKVWTGN
jgi:hypothetical protein